MADILDFPPETEAGEENVCAIQVAYALNSLFISGAICKDALFLGAQVCGRMHLLGVDQYVMTGREATENVTRINGMIFGGPVSMRLLDYISALQDLHFRGAVLNDPQENRVYDPKRYTKHFTLDPLTSAGVHWSMDTPIVFRLLPMKLSNYQEAIEAMIKDSLGEKKVVDVLVEWEEK